MVAHFLAQTQLTHNTNDNTPPPWLPAMARMNTFECSYGYNFIHRESQSTHTLFNTRGLFFMPLDLRLRPNNAITHYITYNPRPLCPPLPPLTTTLIRALFNNPLAMKLHPKIVFAAKIFCAGKCNNIAWFWQIGILNTTMRAILCGIA